MQMSGTELVLDHGQVTILTRETVAPRASKLGELADELRKLTQAIMLHWHDMPEPMQMELRGLADYLKKPRNIGFWARLRFAYLALLAGPTTFEDYMDAVIRFREALLGTLDREQRAFDQMMNDEAIRASIEQGWADVEAGNTRPLGEALEYLEQD